MKIPFVLRTITAPRHWPDEESKARHVRPAPSRFAGRQGSASLSFFGVMWRRRPCAGLPEFSNAAVTADEHWVIDVDQALRALVARDGSDLHLKPGSAPTARVRGELVPLGNDVWPVLDAADTEGALRQMLGDGARLAEFEANHEIDISCEIPGVARFRINARHQRGGIALVARAIPHRISTIERCV